MRKPFLTVKNISSPPLWGLSLLVVVFIFSVLITFFFHEGWLDGKSIQGIDGNYSIRLVHHQNLIESTKGFWIDEYWLGRGSSWMFKTKFFFLKIAPVEWSLTACFATMMFLGLTGMFLFLRRNGLAVWSCCFGALAYGLTPHYITLVYPCHIDSFNQLGYVPWVFLLLMIALDKSAVGWRSWLAAALAGAVWGMVMNEDVQRGLYISVLASSYAVFLLWPCVRTHPMKIRPVLIHVLKTVLVGIVLLLVFSNNFERQMGSPLVQGKRGVASAETKQTERDKWEFATSWSLHPKELLDTFYPGYHGMISGDPERPYWGERPVAHSNDSLGYFVAVFGLAGILSAFRKSGTVRFFTIAAVLATLLAFGKYMPGKPLFWLWYHMPMMAKMRAPVKFMCVTAFALSILSAFGFQLLLEAIRRGEHKATKRWLFAFGGLLCVGVISLLSTIMNESTIVAEAFRRTGQHLLASKAYDYALLAVVKTSLFSLAGVGLLAVAVYVKKPRYMMQAVLAGFVAMLVLDLYAIDRYYIKQSWFKPKEFYQPDEMIQFLKQQSGEYRVCTSLKIMHQGRMVPLSLVEARSMYITHLFPYYGINAMDNTPRSRVALDYSAFFTENLPEFPQARSPDALVRKLLDGQVGFWRLCNVKYILTDGALYGIGRKPVALFELMKQHPDLSLLHTGRGFSGRGMALFEVGRALPRFAIYNGTDPDILNSECREAEIIERERIFIRISVDVSEESTLVWSSRYDKNWIAILSGEPVEMFPVKGILCGLHLPIGKYEIKLRYNPRRWQ